MGNYRKLWFTLIGVLIVTFGFLGYYGAEVYRVAPPIPQKVLSADGPARSTHDGILDGQTAWQSVGGMQLGSIWGHGAYQAPDWTTDWLHRGCWPGWTWPRRRPTPSRSTSWAPMPRPCCARLKKEYHRTNTFDAATGAVTVSRLREQAIARNAAYYSRLFSDAPDLHETRNTTR